MRSGVGPIAKTLSRLLLLPVAALTLSANGGGAGPGAPQLVVMAPIVVPIVGSDRLDGSLRLKLVVAAQDEHALAAVTKSMPTLRATTVANAIEFSRLYVSARTPVDARKLRVALTAALRASDANVTDLLIVEVAAAA